jgi:hypothetical protein
VDQIYFTAIAFIAGMTFGQWLAVRRMVALLIELIRARSEE